MKRDHGHDRLNRYNPRPSIRGKKFGEIIRLHRVQKGMSQKELAEGICSVSMISGLETDVHGVSPQVLALLAERLEIPLDEFYEGGELKTPAHLDLVEIHIARKEFEKAQNALNAIREREMWDEHRLRWKLLQSQVWNETGEMTRT